MRSFILALFSLFLFSCNSNNSPSVTTRPQAEKQPNGSAKLITPVRCKLR